TDPDHRRVALLLGRVPRGQYQVAVRAADGDPVVIRNRPLLDDGTPMPTLYWLVSPGLRLAVDRLEAAGGVRMAEAAVEPHALADAHHRYAELRDREIPPGWSGNRPSGGVAGTRRGVKCLHAHLAFHLAGGEDPVGQWVATKLAMSAPVAAIDCGTNSTRLLIVGPSGETIERLMQITRLGQRVDQARALDPDAVERTVAVLRRYREVMDRHGVTRVRVIATSAARDATNREAFFSAAEAATGVRPELLDGEEEGALSFAGATAELDPASGPWLVADIGGGSTELVVGAPGSVRPDAVRSLDVGCVRVSERWLGHDPPTPGEMAAARSHIERLVDDASRDLPALRTARQLVGLAGTVSAAMVLSQKLERYDRKLVHHRRLARVTVTGLLSDLGAEPAAVRRRRPGMETERADVIVGGLLVLDCLMGQLDFDTCLVSEADILDGLAATLLLAAT
ncbi:MAG: DUF501 domain-containing protein, partial [Actinomycetota bacterium]|nr:DUF501 domain-containing protein [Actinomycetota bacterium]